MSSDPQMPKGAQIILPSELFEGHYFCRQERDGQHLYNSLVMVDAEGSMLGIHRKNHVPDGPGY